MALPRQFSGDHLGELCARDAADDAGRLGSLCPLEQLMSLDEIVPPKKWGDLGISEVYHESNLPS